MMSYPEAKKRVDARTEAWNKKVEKWMAKQEKALTKEEGRYKKYPRTFFMLFAFAFVISIGIALGYQVFFPPPPVPPEPSLTVFGFFDWLQTIKFQPILWVGIFGFLWMTKW